jgi:hypothetical protein
MAEATVGLNFNEALDVERDVLAEVAFDLALSFNDVADAVQRVLVERAELRVRIDVRLREDLSGAGVADSEDVGETDARLFVARNIDSSNTCHGVPFSVELPASPESGVMVCGRSAGFNASLDFG